MSDDLDNLLDMQTAMYEDLRDYNAHLCEKYEIKPAEAIVYTHAMTAFLIEDMGKGKFNEVTKMLKRDLQVKNVVVGIKDRLNAH